MEVTSVNAVPFIEAVIQPNIILTIVERVGLLVRCVVGCRCIYIGYRKFFHRAEDISNCFPIRRDPNGKTVQSQICQITTGNRLTGWYDCAVCRIDRGVTHRDIQISGTQTEITEPFCSGWQVAAYRRRILADVLVLLTSKEEELIFLYWSIEIPSEVIKAQFGSLR